MRPLEELQINGFRFVGEQEGDSERLLKEKLIEIFESRRGIERAYLAQVELERAAETSAMLCLYSPKEDKRAILDLVQAAFAGIFAECEHLDIIFLQRDQLEGLNSVCRPFYVRATLLHRLFAR